MKLTLMSAVVLASFAFMNVPLPSGRLHAAQRWRDEPPFINGLIPGWTGLVDPMGRCRFSVPAEWKFHDADRLAFAPDGAATVEEAWAPASSWARYKAGLYGFLEPTVLHEDSTQRIWFEYAAGWAGVHHHVAVPTPDGACLLRIDIRSRAADALNGVIRRTAGSLVALP